MALFPANDLDNMDDSPRKKSSRLEKKLLLLRIGVGLVLGLLVSSTGFYLARRALMHQIRDNLASYILLIEAETRIFLHRKDMAITSAARDPALEKYFTTSRLSLLNDLLSRYAYPFASISYLNSRGEEEARLIRGQTTDELQDRKTENDYRTALSRPGRMVITGIKRDKVLNDLVFKLYFHRRDFFDRDIGTIVASVPARELAATLEGAMETINSIRSKRGEKTDALQSQGEEFMVVDRKGVILAHSNREMIGHRAAEVSPQLTPSKPHFNNEGTININGETYFVDTIPMGKTGWRLFFLANESQVMAPINDLGKSIFLLTLIFLISAELFSRRLGLSLTEPINRLLEKTREISVAGVSNGRVEWKSRDEIGELAKSFNSMLDRIEAAQRELRNEKHFIEDIFDAMEEGLVVTDIHGRISEHNRAAREILAVADLNGKSLGEFFPATVPAHTWWPEVAAGRHISNRESSIINDHGEEIPVSLSLAPLFQDAKNARGLVCGITDIRERKRLEEDKNQAAIRLSETRDELMAAEKLAVVGQMSGMVAHEVLNPISAINVRISMALPAMDELARVIEVMEKITRNWQDKNGDNTLATHLASENGQKDLMILGRIATALREKHSERSEDFRFLDRQVTRIIKIIDNLREMSRHQKTEEDVDLTRLINEVIEDQRDGLGKRKITVEKEFTAAPGLRADFMEIYSIFSNLLRNSIHAIDTRGGGDGRIKFKVKIDEDMAEVTVSDNGCGMTAETMENLFTPGFTSKGRKGTGLGLSYSRKIARAMHGDLFLSASKAGEGSTFKVFLPLAEKQENQEVQGA